MADDKDCRESEMGKMHSPSPAIKEGKGEVPGSIPAKGWTSKSFDKSLLKQRGS